MAKRMAKVTYTEKWLRTVTIEREFDDADHPDLVTAAINATEEVSENCSPGDVGVTIEPLSFWDSDVGDVFVDGVQV